MGAVLGIDTSCYTTSCALANEKGLIGQRRRLLSVELGGRGLMQSEGVFQHVGRLPALIEALMGDCGHPQIDAVCASVLTPPARVEKPCAVRGTARRSERKRMASRRNMASLSPRACQRSSTMLSSHMDGAR